MVENSIESIGLPVAATKGSDVMNPSEVASGVHNGQSVPNPYPTYVRTVVPLFARCTKRTITKETCQFSVEVERPFSPEHKCTHENNQQHDLTVCVHT